MKLISGLLIALALTGCASREQYGKTVSSWEGHSEDELIAIWGPPQSVYEVSEDEKILTYTTKKVVETTSFSPAFGYTYGSYRRYGFHGVHSGQSRVTEFSCSTNFTVTRGAISDWNFQGNGCSTRQCTSKSSNECLPIASNETH
ncbi:hypothetical protein [Kiloniella sp. b19]|uniref:hypothetical protein n=1 Tax=Kiloniella sp. GXU_MW_B19 TaxID=3141326 RepID=UPI0031D30056